MGFKEFLDYANSFADDIELFTSVTTPESILKSNAEDYKKLKKFCAITLIIVVILCVGAMYLKFRVWGN